MVFKKIRKSHVDWRDFLCGTPASDYIFQKDAYEEQIENAVNFIKQDFQQKKYLRHKVIMERFSVREDAIQRSMTQKNYSERWMPGEGTV